MSDPTRAPSAGSRVRRSRRRSRIDARRPRTPRSPVVTFLALATYAVLLLVAVGMAALAISIRAAGDQPVHWGTFHLTDRDCSPSRSGPSCTWIGTWTPQDGSPPVSDVEYDSGSTDPDDAPVADVRTGYRDVDRVGTQPDTVWDVDGVDSTWGTPTIFAAIVVAVLAILFVRWGEPARLRDWWRDRSERPGR